MTTTTSPAGTQQHDVSRFMFGTAGLIALVVGVLILIWPGKTAVAVLATIAALIGLWTIVNGVVHIGSALISKERGGWSRAGYSLLGVLFVIGGIVIMSNLFLSAITVTLLISVTVGVLWIIEGVFAFALLKESPHKVLSVIYAILGIIAGIMLLLSPLFGAFVMWWFVGASLVALGLVQVIRAFTIKQADPAAAASVV